MDLTSLRLHDAIEGLISFLPGEEKYTEVLKRLEFSHLINLIQLIKRTKFILGALHGILKRASKPNSKLESRQELTRSVLRGEGILEQRS